MGCTALTCLEWHKKCSRWPSPGIAVTCRTAARDRRCRPPREGERDPRAEAVQADHPHAGGRGVCHDREAALVQADLTAQVLPGRACPGTPDQRPHLRPLDL